MTIGSKVILCEPVIVVEDTRTVFLPKGTGGSVATLEDGHLTISVDGKDYGGIPTESVQEGGRPYAGT